MIIFSLLGLLLLLFVAYVLIKAMTSPKHSVFSRSITINKSPAEVFPFVSSLRAFNDWNPWLSTDPDSILTYSGTEGEVGEFYDWEGKRSGTGKMTLVESKPSHLIRNKIEFFSPMEGVAEGRFILDPTGENTKFTWEFETDHSFKMRIFGALMSYEKMMGKSFDQGLNKLKKLVEG